MQVLIVEQYNHFKVLENTHHLLTNHCSTHFYINKDRNNNIELLFPSSKYLNIITNPLHFSIFYIWPLIIGWKYKYINISTGPECSDYWEFFNIIFFYIFCIVYKNKIILTVKNTRPYLKSSAGLFSYIRSHAVKKLKRFVFETKTMGKVFRADAELGSCYIGAVYDRYTDLLTTDMQMVMGSRAGDKIRIGLLGMIDSKRRDYDVVLEVLKQLSDEERSKLKIVTLGACTKGYNNKIIKRLCEYVEVDLIEGWISSEEFDSRGVLCDLLIAPLRETMEYGTYKGTGSLGDAIYLRKKIILPSYVDEEGEFDEIALYYNNSSELLAIFRKIKKISERKVADEYYEKFTTTSVFNNLMIDLGFKSLKNNV